MNAGLALPSTGIADAIARSDFWRRSPASAGGVAGHKEWSYFSVFGGGVQLLIVFSIMDHPRQDPGASSIEEARVTLLARTDDGRWTGSIQSYEASRVTMRAGLIDAEFGPCRLSFKSGVYRLALSVDDAKVRVELTLRPVVSPALTRSVPLGPGAPMQWFVVPRLEAEGEIRVDRQRFVLKESAAYHDHNWGRFSWGGDFGWEWATVPASGASPWTLVYYRITDRGRHAVTSQGLLVWDRDRHCRTFRDGEITVNSDGYLRTASCRRLPSIMRAAVAGTAGDIPSRLQVTAAAGGDRFDLAFDLTDCAQIGVPHDANEGITLISECHATAAGLGSLRGRVAEFTCPSIVEFNRGEA